MEEKLSKLNQSVEKTMRLVEIMARSGAPRKLQSIAQEANMPASTALRMLNTLLRLGYVNQDPETLKYSLSLKFSYLGELAAKQVSPTSLAHPLLFMLSRRTGECTCFAEKQDDQAVYLDVFSDASDGILTVTRRIGRRAPLYCTGVGKLFLLNDSHEELEHYFERTPIVRYTDRTITTLSGLERELADIRSRGYAVDNEECDRGARCIAAPVRDYTGRVIAGISVTAPALRMTPERMESLVPLVVGTAAQISRKLAFET